MNILLQMGLLYMMDGIGYVYEVYVVYIDW